MTLILAYSPSGTYTAQPSLSAAMTDLRRDLCDRAALLPSDLPARWDDDALARALDRAVDEYSFVSPLIQSVLTSTLPDTRAYAYPPGAWWIESVEYPAGCYPPITVPFEESVTPSLGVPTSPTASVAGSGELTGTYTWSVTFFKSGGETVPGAASRPLTLRAQAAALSFIPLGPPGTVGRAVYRARGDSDPALVIRILDNITTSFVDDVPDTDLGATAPTADTTANLMHYLLRLPSGRVPTDTSGTLAVTYAAKHVLDEAGTSIPERDHDVVLLGAAAYAMLAYQIPQNDLFEYQDGEMRDRIDERGVAAAWLAAGSRALDQFHARLTQIEEQRNAGAAAVAQWGDIPVWWRRL